MTALQEIRTHLNPGQVYRRSDIEKWSNAVDRHLSQLQEEKALFKLSGGMYYCPKESPFGPVPPSDLSLVKTKAQSMNQEHLKNALLNYGGVRARKILKSIAKI